MSTEFSKHFDEPAAVEIRAAALELVDISAADAQGLGEERGANIHPLPT
ncbi:hypothetical protein N802_08370 [Knoellia sinensis KCTC 19936]|uniref:Uncharacterized protein n=1 Tax=Knoellia sinensis KCTC 19936 TaxID=1385520 RepID=A0A0A0JB00_9MICO|nr:hypothetical protein [Knoellia sinensis]KGN33964.1 hypothetical protein N802_08370 [Knoellia sinensis KCTC 19936]